MMPLTLLAAMLAQASPALIEGQWANPSASVVMRIAPCGDMLCGTVVSATDKAKADARKGGTEDLIGAQLLTGLQEKQPGRWSGRLFIPDINKRSRAKLELTTPDSLKVSGCLVGKMLCRSQTWTRAGN